MILLSKVYLREEIPGHLHYAGGPWVPEILLLSEQPAGLASIARVATRRNVAPEYYSILPKKKKLSINPSTLWQRNDRHNNQSCHACTNLAQV